MLLCALHNACRRRDAHFSRQLRLPQSRRVHKRQVPIPQRIGLACEKWHGHVNPGEPGFLRGYPLLPFALRRLRLLASVCSVASSLAFRESFGSTLCPPPLISIHEPWKSASDGRHLNPRCTSFRYISYHMKYQ